MHPMRKIDFRFQTTQVEDGRCFGKTVARVFRRWRVELECGHHYYLPLKEGWKKLRMRCRKCPEEEK